MTISDIKEIIEKENLSDDDEVMISMEGVFTTLVEVAIYQRQGKKYIGFSQE